MQYLYIKVVIYKVRDYNYSNTIIDIFFRDENSFKKFYKKLYICKNTYYYHIIIFQLVNLLISKEFLKD